jgi:flavin-binding protein dodecin
MQKDMEKPMSIDQEQELLNKIHREAIARARDTGSEADWQDAQSIEHTIQEFGKVARNYITMTHKLSALKAFASIMIQEHGGTASCNLLKEIAPELYVELLEAGRGHQSTGV